jgi:hypothetical protein
MEREREREWGGEMGEKQRAEMGMGEARRCTCKASAA